MNNATEITDSNFDSIIKSNKVVVVDFSATWCGPCRTLAPMIDQLAIQFRGKAVIGKIDVDGNPNSTAKFAVRNIPAILFFRDGKLVDKQTGGATQSALSAKINSYL